MEREPTEGHSSSDVSDTFHFGLALALVLTVPQLIKMKASHAASLDDHTFCLSDLDSPRFFCTKTQLQVPSL